MNLKEKIYHLSMSDLSTISEISYAMKVNHLINNNAKTTHFQWNNKMKNGNILLTLYHFVAPESIQCLIVEKDTEAYEEMIKFIREDSELLEEHIIEHLKYIANESKIHFQLGEK